jgi:hypothetical protein
MNAGRQLLGICINELFPEDVLQYLPSRYLLWFQYAAVFLLKVSHTPGPCSSQVSDPKYCFSPINRRCIPGRWCNLIT